MFGQGAQAPQLKFNDLFNQHFPRLIFLKYFVRKNWGVGGELLNYYQKMIQYMVTPTNHDIAGPDLHRARPLALWGFFQDLSAKYRGRPNKVLQFERGAPSWYCAIL